jgi:hypothetical protein
MSSGPKDVEARGDFETDFGVYAGGFKLSDEPLLEARESALMTSALAAPTTWRIEPFMDVIIIGASFNKSLALLTLDMYEWYEFLDEMAEGKGLEDSSLGSILRFSSGERMGRIGNDEVVEGRLGDSEFGSDARLGTRAMGITLVPSVPAVWIEFVSSKGLVGDR